MKLFLILIFFLSLSGCSFDDKSGIWNNSNDIDKDNKDEVFKDFKKLTSSKISFNKIIAIDKKFKFEVNEPFENKSWPDVFYNINNNVENFKFDNSKRIISKTKKLTKYKINNYILYDNNNLIFSDQRGNVITYSIKKKIITSKINFYKKKFKNIQKFLNIITENGNIYIADNIGYIYAYNYENDQILWAKNLKVPFRSNLKVYGNNLIASNQNNDLLILNKLTGATIKLIPTEQTAINNVFINNISLNDQDIFFLNTYGSLYAIEKNNLKLRWFINLNENYNSKENNLFFGNPIINFNNNIIASSNDNLYLFDAKTGTIKKKMNISLNTKPILTDKYIFLVSRNNLLLSMNLLDGEIIYSIDIEEKVANFLKSKKKSLNIKNIYLVNNNIFILLKNSHIISFDLRGEINEIFKLPSKMTLDPIFINNSLLYFNSKNKLITLN
jgi:outer membrane protein assembly factor BamB